MQLNWRTAANAIVWEARSSRAIIVADGWTHILASFNTATSVRHLFIDDVEDTVISETFNADAIATYAGVDTSVGPAALKFNGDLSEVYIGNEFLDLSVVANRRKFISAAGDPVFMGSSGQLPTGSAPMIYLSGPTVNWHLNASGRGTFVESGALTTASSVPPD